MLSDLSGKGDESFRPRQGIVSRWYLRVEVILKVWCDSFKMLGLFEGFGGEVQGAWCC